MELQIIKKEMFFLLLYGFIVLTIALLMMGLFAQNSMFYLFEWVWLFYLGKLFSAIFFLREEQTEQEREALLEKELNENRQTFIPKQVYLVNSALQLGNVFLICFQLFYMNFGLFVICQSIIFISYVIYTNKHHQMHYIYSGALILGGIFSIAYYDKGNDRCYIGLIATLFQIGINILSQQQKEQFFSGYVFSNAKFITFTGLCQFVLWTLPVVIVNFIPCPEDQKPTSTSGQPNPPPYFKCPGDQLDEFSNFFTSTFDTSNVYPIIVFFVLLFVGSPLSYLDNKISIENLQEKKQIIEQFVFLPIQIWAFSLIKDDADNTNEIVLYVLCIICFVIQWITGLHIIFANKIQKYEPIDEDEDSELS